MGFYSSCILYFVEDPSSAAPYWWSNKNTASNRSVDSGWHVSKREATQVSPSTEWGNESRTKAANQASSADGLESLAHAACALAVA